MDTSLTQSCDSLRQAIDDEIYSLQESLLALKSRRNALAPISRLPPEILAAIFFLLPPSAWVKKAGNLAKICVTHVCRQWRETALNYPRLWSDFNFTKLTPAGMAEILALAQMTPLHLEADITQWRVAQSDIFVTQLEARIPHTRHLIISSGRLQTTLDRLVSSAPTLEFLSLSHNYAYGLPPAVIPINLFNNTAPRLTSVKLEKCDISWKLPLFKRLRNLKIIRPSTEARPKLEDWLGALNEMPQLETLILQSVTPLASQAAPLVSGPSRTATLPSLTRFDISASARDCALALAYLVLPALTWLHVDAEAYDAGGEDVHLGIPYVAQNVYGLQDTGPLRSILISGKRTRIKFLACTMPDPDIKVSVPHTSFRASDPARLVFTATCRSWNYGVASGIFDALLTHLPVNYVSTLAAQNCRRLNREFWLSQASRLPLLERALLDPTTFMAFTHMLGEDAPPDGPRLPLLSKLNLVDFILTSFQTDHLRDMLIERVEQGVPLEVLDLSACAVVENRSIQLLGEIVVVDLHEPQAAQREILACFSSHGRIRYCDESEVEYDDVWRPWYFDTSDDEDEEDEEGVSVDEGEGEGEGEDEDEGVDVDDMMGLLTWYILLCSTCHSAATRIHLFSFLFETFRNSLLQSYAS